MRRVTTIMILMFLYTVVAQAQITIGGKVYGGGKAGDLTGSTKVTVYAGEIKEVYGGAQQANVGGHTFVHLDGEHASDDIFIENVYGGNDISGTIGKGNVTTTIPTELENIKKTDADANDKTKNAIDNSWKTFVRTSACKNKVPVTVEGVGTLSIDANMLVVGSLFGGSNGDYDYTSGNADTNPYFGLTVPEISKTYLEIKGGDIAHVYGGGNNATVTEATTIHIDNSSDDLQKGAIVFARKHPEIENIIQYFQSKVRLATFQAKLDSWAFNHARIYGGNNKAKMEIMPKWNLQKGIIRDLYSGGNEGDMICKNGLLLEIDPAVDPVTGNKDKLEIVNVYGGCRRADVHPMNKITSGANAGEYEDAPAYSPSGYKFPRGLSARTLVRGGKIHNVYGGNDISGKVYGGNAVGIYSDILGDVYGGGNGSYAYTDNSDLATHKEYKDFYYDKGSSSVEALTAFRPNAEQVSIRLAGTVANPVTIWGSVYVGGNSATLKKDESKVNNPEYPNYPMVELKIGSYVTADKVFLGNNGESMVDNSADGVLAMYAGVTDKVPDNYSTLNLTVKDTFAEYMKGCAMDMTPNVVFDNEQKGDPDTYKEYTSYFGSFYCGGNVGSMTGDGLTEIDFDKEVVIFDKFVGGCNNANVSAQEGYNAKYDGGITGAPESDTGNKIVLNLSGLRIEPKRWIDENNKKLGLEWNTWIGDTKNVIAPKAEGSSSTESPASIGVSSEDDLARRFQGGNIYGGCYSSGYVKGNVVINLNGTIVNQDVVFDDVQEDHEGEAILYDHENYLITEPRTGVILDQQGMDVLGKSLNVFGGGKGRDTEIWGSTTINLNAGYTFQIFGGSEEGVIGKPLVNSEGKALTTTLPDNTYNETTGEYAFNGKIFKYDPAYSCYVNLKGDFAGVTKTSTDNSPLMADCEFLYGGGFFGPICGNTVINLGKGRNFNSFAGSCMADILGHTETYIGRMVMDEYQNMMGKLGSTEGGLDDDKYYEEGFPWVRDITYGGNDLGGKIFGSKDFTSRVRSEALGKVYNPGNKPSAEVLTASAYTEYLQGRADAIFGGCYGTYDYKESRFSKFFNSDGTPKDGYDKPFMDNAFVNFRPTFVHANNKVNQIFGAGQGADQATDPRRDGDLMQNSSYVLIDVPSDMDYYGSTAVFGGGKFNGLGMAYNYNNSTGDRYKTLPAGFDLDHATAIIDLARGKVGNVYGGSYDEGIVRRTIVNVPSGSTINVNNLFGGGFGADVNIPCDVIEAQVNYHSAAATVRNNIYGGNNNADRTLYGQVNITKPVWQNEKTGYLAKVYGAGLGVGTWSQYTEVNLLPGAKVYAVYGGGENGQVVNTETLKKWSDDDKDLDLRLHAYTDSGLNDPLAKETALGGKYNTNVHIHKDALVYDYAYGGGLGDSKIEKSGDVYGSTYIDLLGGKVNKDIYAAGTTGSVCDGYGAKTFTASTTAYIEGGKVRNVYGGGWLGDVGKPSMDYTNTGWTGTYDATKELPGETHVVIGIPKERASETEGYGFYKGVPTVERNAYGGGEGGAVYGKSNLTLNNGYIGYRFFDSVPTEDFPYYTDGGGYYQEKINDETYYVEGSYQGDDRLKDCGNMFGGGYDVRSCVDESSVKMYGGVVRNSMHGGGEIATIGRGNATEDGAVRTVTHLYKPGKTLVEMYNGHVRHNVFAGGKGYNVWGYGQQGTLYTDGYVFGATEVQIHGGEIGTKEGVEDGYGNVFGGGDIGYVYSGSFFTGSHTEGTGSPGHYYYKDAAGNLTEDCKVVIAPYLQAKNDFGTYKKYDYVPTDYLNTLPGKNANKQWDAAWDNLTTVDADGTERGIMIHNGVFAGGNVSSNSDTQYANATTVYGNTTATLYDVYNRDFITIGTEHTGGLYGGGNWTLVNGYRELNITNYGTDYYGLESTISLDEYRSLSNRERAYFQLQYQCKANITLDEEYTEGQTIKEEDYLKLVEKFGNTAKNAFTPFGFCSIYAGRLLNTIQRADFCGVFGSRMVLQGAKDRVADVTEDIDYTINRVGELSLNMQRFNLNSDDDIHGNYFGIYSLVNCMGNLTSDVSFGKTRRYKNGDVESDDPDGKSYYKYKKDCYATGTPLSTRNNGCSHNQVALASGVFLELTTENSTAEEKDYGYITGVVELDLINVKKDLVGGGFVYAKNEHRVPMYYPNKSNVLLSQYNQIVGNEARTYKRYRYADASTNAENDPRWNDSEWTESTGAYIISGETEVPAYTTMVYETSGNFIHPSKQIVDDCYPTNNAYVIGSSNYSKAHYWYLKGSVYVYDQVVSAYTGAASAYSKEVRLPLTITAASHGRLQLLNVKPNLYAYYASDANGNKVKIGTNDTNGKPIDKVWVNNDNDGYGLNEVVTWWDWQQMSYADRQYFVTDTYVNCEACVIDGTEYATGTYVMDETDFAAFKSGSHTMTKHDGTPVTMDNVAELFRSSNNVGHDTGYVLTFDMDSPDIWNDYYTKISSSTPLTDKERESVYLKSLEDAEDDNARQAIINTWREGPTFTPRTQGVYGQRQIAVGNILTAEEVGRNTAGSGTPATVERAYVATQAVTYNYTYTDEDNVERTITKTTNAGTAIPETEYNGLDATTKAFFAAAFVCTQTVKLAEEKYLFYGDLMSASQIDQLKTDYSGFATDIQEAMTAAYICSSPGGFGGQRFDVGTNYSALTTWCSLPMSERIDGDGNDTFTFNYDALDLLADPDYLTVVTNATKIENPEHERTVEAFHSPYTDQVGVEYKAVYKAPNTGDTYSYPAGTCLDGVTTYPARELSDGDYIDQDIFEAAVRNDKTHYTRITIKSGGETLYFATKNFVYNGVPYGVGQEIDESVYNANTDCGEQVFFANTSNSAAVKYYCYDAYDNVEKGTLIDETAFGNLRNDQKYFVIQGKEPTENTTLYVSSESDAKDVTTERVYTVVYQYTYYEEQDDHSMKLNNELHVINIHIDLKSGAPYIGELNPPGTVLPSWGVGLTAPEVKPGLVPIITNGWDLFLTEDDAINQRNPAEFVNNGTPVYWYQNQKNYIAFYSKTIHGKTYSNYVPLSVANYHDLDAVMKAKDHHLYVDRADVDRPSKIYIDNRECESDPDKSELDLLKDFYDLSVLSGSPAEGSALEGHAKLNSHVQGGNNLEFILRSDISPKATYTVDNEEATWSSIGSGSDPCFSGNLHGDGHTISGLDHSLFDKLCGEVYNLGVTGSFTEAGIANTGEGYIENCWVKSSAVSGFPADTYPVFGNPSRDASDDRGPIQVVNCYYPESNAYNIPASTTHGKATQMPDKAFYNGTVAYNLNGFYLKKRYYDNNTSWKEGLTDAQKITYSYLPSDADGTLPEEMVTAYYPTTYAVYQPKRTDEKPEERPWLGYVESRFYDGDFIYAGGTIPESNNIRMRTITTTTANPDGSTTTTAKNYYTPIWPDDYLFFGQTLNYGHVDGIDHQAQPSAINRSDERVDESDSGNRVYRAPAYFRSGNMDVAHFNPAAVFAQTKNGDASITAYKGMTAIDFTGYHDYNSNSFVDGWATHQPNGVNGAYWTAGANTANSAFYPPLLDDDGLSSIQNVDLTRNLLVYTSAPGTSAAGKTGTVVSNYLHDEEYEETNSDYHTVDVFDSFSDVIRGHWVQQTGTDSYSALRDHLLVDKQDFNAPIEYTFGDDYRMWYQRVPDNYVGQKNADGTAFIDNNAGWESISLPFKAEIVTTDQKGEITHFYGGSWNSKNNTGKKIGHEYWLREFTDITEETKEVEGVSTTFGVATLTYPAANSTDGQKDYTNTFLWDYYYSHNSYNDQNGDDYQENDEHHNYYRYGREYPNYPRLANGKPYIIGFPGERYYEFDLSGKFKANTAMATIPALLKPQTITFASATGATIAISDSETGDEHTYRSNKYTFKPNYLNMEVDENGYVLNAEGSQYDKVTTSTTTAAKTVLPFRPYFTVKVAGSREATRSIVFSGDEANMAHEANDVVPGTISAYAGKHKIIVTSTLKVTTDVRIVNTAGQVMASFPIKSGETIETRINNAGVYIVQDEEGKYIRKLAVE